MGEKMSEMDAVAIATKIVSKFPQLDPGLAGGMVREIALAVIKHEQDAVLSRMKDRQTLKRLGWEKEKVSETRRIAAQLLHDALKSNESGSIWGALDKFEERFRKYEF
jgi:hypothetical protein